MEKAIFTNLCMIYDDQGHVLVQNRTSKHWPGVTFPGGHVEEQESFIESTIREVKEETGLDISDLELCGLKQWPTDEGERYVVILYKTNCFKGELTSSIEGEVFWVKKEDLKNYPLAEDFEMMLGMFEHEFSEFFYYKEDDDFKIKLL